MSVLDALEFRPEAAARTDTPAADTRAAPGVLDQLLASTRVEVDRVEDVQALRRAEAYTPLIDALVERGIDRAALVQKPFDPLGLASDRAGVYRYDQIWREARRLGIEGLPAKQADFERDAYRRGGDRDADLDLLARGGGAGGTVAQFAGGMIGSFADPINVYTLPFGGTGRTIAERIITEAMIGAGTELAQAAVNEASYARMGEEYGWRDAVQDVALAGAGAGVLRGGIEASPAAGRGIARIDAAGYRAAAPVREMADRIFGDRDMARALAQAVPDHLQTAEQAAAVRVMAREADLGEASPYVSTYEGGDAHRARLQDVADEMAHPSPGGFQLGRYMARNRSAESGGDDAAAAVTSSAFGRYQFLGDTWVDFYRRTFGETGESRAAILAQRADGAVQDRVMETFTRANADALRRAGAPVDDGTVYLAHFLGVRDALRVLAADPEAPLRGLISDASLRANPGVFGDIGSASELVAWARGKMGERGRGLPARGGGVLDDLGDDGVLAALGAERVDLELARARAAGGDDVPVQAADLPELPPPLRRDLFPDDTSWRVAQAQVDAEFWGVDPVYTRQSVWEAARARLEADRRGEVPGALYHPETGPIDVKWGNAKGGLAHIVARHGEMLDQLPAIIEGMELVRESANRVHLESADHVAKVRLDYDGKAQKWLLTAFDKREGKAPPAAEDGGAAGSARDRSPSAGAGADIGEGAPLRNLSPAEALADRWAQDPAPLFVARDADGAVTGWSGNRAELDARSPDGTTIARETPPEARPGPTGDVLARFDDTAGDGARLQAESDWHDVRAQAPEQLAFDLEDGRGMRTAAEIEEEIRADRAAIAEIRKCMI